MTIKHYINLSNGWICGCDVPSPHGITRIQSTACEQKRWASILDTLGADLLYNLAQGNACVIHDRSEKERETRACWQGLSWIRYATHRAWNPGLPPPSEKSRGGMALNRYWERVYQDLPNSTKHLLKYYRKYYTGGAVRLYSCYRTQVGLAIFRKKHQNQGVDTL